MLYGYMGMGTRVYIYIWVWPKQVMQDLDREETDDADDENS